MSGINFMAGLEKKQIVKHLKNATFVYDEELQEFTIVSRKEGENPRVVKFNKVEIFALQRFLIRFAQRNWYRKKKIIKKEVNQNNRSNKKTKQLRGL